MDIFNTDINIIKKYGILPRNIYIPEKIPLTQNNMFYAIDNGYIDNYISNIEQHKDVSGYGNNSKSLMCIKSYINKHTPNKIIYIKHDVGSGKSFKSLDCAMDFNRDICILVVHKAQEIPFEKELEIGGIISKIYPMFNNKIIFITGKMLTDSYNEDKERVDYLFDNSIVIIDEAHHTRNRYSNIYDDDKPQYRKIKNTLNNDNIVAKIFLSATPIIDSKEELKGIGQLLGYNFDIYDNIYDKKLYGPFFSHLSEKFVNVTHVDIPCVMVKDGIQERSYLQYENDSRGIYTNLLSISRICVKGYNIDVSSNDISSDTLGRLCEELEESAIKYHELLKILINKTGELSYVHDNWKVRGGLDMLIKIFVNNGFNIIRNLDDMLNVNMGRKIFAPHMLEHNYKIIPILFELYNDPRNDGSLAEIIILSPKYAEYISIRNTPTAYMLSEFWNFGTEKQAEGRITRRSNIHKNVTINKFVLYKSDGSKTIDHHIRKISHDKYQEVKKIYKYWKELSIEKYYTEECKYSYRFDNYRQTRYNNSIRHCNKNIYFRYIKYEQFFDILRILFISDINLIMERDEKNYISSIIPAVEKYAILYYNGEINNELISLLNVVKLLFYDIEGESYNILYSMNNDTTDYQRFSNEDKIQLRKFNNKERIWEDCNNTIILDNCLSQYKNLSKIFEKNILLSWREVGYYIVIYTLHRCCRLVKYIEDNTAIRKYVCIKDNRKVSRGMNWKSMHISDLNNILNKLLNMSIRKNIFNKNMIFSKSKESIIINIYHLMKDNNMLLILPG